MRLLVQLVLLVLLRELFDQLIELFNLLIMLYNLLIELQVSQLESKITQISDDNQVLANSASKSPPMPLEVSLDGQISSKFEGLSKITALQHQLSQLQESNDLFRS